jgi:uncharacterized membrane protein
MNLPPLHPILVNFTAALVPVSFISDVIGRIWGRPSLHSAGWWTLLYGAVVTPFTALAGWYWLRSMPSAHDPDLPIHQWLGVALAGALIPLTVWRGMIYRKQARPGISYLVAAGGLLAVLVYQAHLGGSMTFGDGEETSSSAPATTASVDQRQRQVEWRDHLEVP